MTDILRRLARAGGLAALVILVAFAAPAGARADTGGGNTYDRDTILAKAEGFFGTATKGLAKVIQKVFEDHGEPNAFITGEEGSGAFIVGARYGSGVLHRKNARPRKVYWQGPSVGFDVGGNASKVFVLVYNLKSADALFQRFPGVEGSYYLVAGVGVNYQAADGIVLAPIRTGVGLRAGINAGYLSYSRERSWNPF